MEEVRKTRGAIRRRVARLWRVLVVSGAVMGVACGTCGKAKDGKGASGDRPGGAAQGGGAQSW